MFSDELVIDDRSSNDTRSNLGTTWRLVTDTVMGGVSQGRLTPEVVEGRSCLRLTGDVSLENNGGFVQASLDLAPAETLNGSGYEGFEIDVYGNGESYNLHLRTTDTRIVQQSYRVSFTAPPDWQTLRFPFDTFQPHRIEKPLDIRQLKRLGFVAIGREITADLSIGRTCLYR